MKYLIIIITLTSCSLFKSDFQYLETNDQVSDYKTGDYEAHLKSLSSSYINTPGVKRINLTRGSIKYLKEVYYRMVNNNELLLKKGETPKFFVIKNKIPFVFSLPGSQFFLSTGLLTRYLKNEALLASVLAYEIIKSSRQMYKKKFIVPVGFVKTAKMLSLTRLDLKEKSEINKWSFFVLKRAGYDPFAILNWIQTQNKNTLDFSFHLGGARNISKEEFMFKNFLAQRSERGEENFILKNSSSGFYVLLNDVKRKSL